MSRWAVAFPFIGVAAALLVLAPNSMADVPRTLTSLAIAVGVAAISFGYVWLRSRASRRRAADLSAIATVTSDPDSLELAAHIAGVEAPRLGSFALVDTADGIQLWSTSTHLDVALPWSSIRSVDLMPTPLVGGRTGATIAVFTTVSPRIAITLVPQGSYGVARPGVERSGTIVAHLRELQARASAPSA